MMCGMREGKCMNSMENILPISHSTHLCQAPYQDIAISEGYQFRVSVRLRFGTRKGSAVEKQRHHGWLQHNPPRYKETQTWEKDETVNFTTVRLPRHRRALLDSDHPLNSTLRNHRHSLFGIRESERQRVKE